MKFPVIVLFVFIFPSCSEIRTNDPIESYKYWSGAKPTAEIEMVKGQYWQSSHWTKEYILYLKLLPTNVWWGEFVKQNNLVLADKDWNRPHELPDWFQVDDDFEMYKPLNDINESRYFRDTETGECYIYEIQL